MPADGNAKGTEWINNTFQDFDSLDQENKALLLIQDYRDVQGAVESAHSEIARAAKMMADAYLEGKKIVFCGAGTSGRLGVLQHAECPPTFGTPEEKMMALMAGGKQAVFRSVEGAEDSFEDGYQEADAMLQENDVIIGMSASGSTRYVLGALSLAKERKCRTIALVCNADSRIGKACDINITLLTGPEFPHGGTRKKAGQAQKMAADVLTTLMNVEIGNIYQGEMIGMKGWLSEKLRRRAERIVQRICGCDEANARDALETSGYRTKEAIVMLACDVSLDAAGQILDGKKGRIQDILKKDHCS